MQKNIRQYFLIGALAGATAIAVPATAQQYPNPTQNPPDRQDQVRHDQSDQNQPVQDRDSQRINQDQDQTHRNQGDQDRQINQDQDQIRRDQDQNRQYQDRDNQTQYQGDRDRTSAYGGNQQWVNSKAYQEGLKDGRHDRAKNRSQRTHEKRWKNDQDRQAYDAGYNSGFGGNQPENNERNEQHR